MTTAELRRQHVEIETAMADAVAAVEGTRRRWNERDGSVSTTSTTTTFRPSSTHAPIIQGELPPSRPPPPAAANTAHTTQALQSLRHIHCHYPHSHCHYREGHCHYAFINCICYPLSPFLQPMPFSLYLVPLLFYSLSLYFYQWHVTISTCIHCHFHCI